MALTLRWENGHGRITPWPIDWAPYNDPQRNALFRTAPSFAPPPSGP
jgi:hypothetical protein